MLFCLIKNFPIPFKENIEMYSFELNTSGFMTKVLRVENLLEKEQHYDSASCDVEVMEKEIQEGEMKKVYWVPRGARAGRRARFYFFALHPSQFFYMRGFL